MSQSTGKTILITGASAGIGRAWAENLCRIGHRVTGVARRKERLEEIEQAFESFKGLSVDLSSDGERARLCETYLAENGAPDYLILNAGRGHYGAFHKLSSDLLRDQVELNLWAVADMIHRFLPAMLERGQGRIIVVASALGHGAIPYSNMYAASKHAVLGLVKSLRLELRGSGVTCSAICPAGVQTEFGGIAADGARQNQNAEEPLERVMAGIMRKMDRNRAFIFPTFQAWLLSNLFRVCPRLMEFVLGRKSVRSKFSENLPEDRI